jgi:MFS family permease
LPISIAFGWFYFLVTILPSTYGQIYHFSTGTIGLCYLAGGIGNTSGSIFAGAISDRLYAKAVASNGGVKKTEFRLRPMYIGVPLIVAGATMYGWFLHAHLHFMGPLVAYTISKFFFAIRKRKKQIIQKLIIIYLYSHFWYHVHYYYCKYLLGRF